MTPDDLRSLASDSRVPEGAARDDERQWQKRDEALRTLVDEDFARLLALLCAELGEALAASIPARCQALAPSSPNYRNGEECGRCSYCRARAAFAKLEELEATHVT